MRCGWLAWLGEGLVFLGGSQGFQGGGEVCHVVQGGARAGAAGADGGAVDADDFVYGVAGEAVDFHEVYLPCVFLHALAIPPHGLVLEEGGEGFGEVRRGDEGHFWFVCYGALHGLQECFLGLCLHGVGGVDVHGGVVVR